MNFSEMFSKVDEDSMIQELPSTLKEEVLFHQFGAIIKKFEFFEKLRNNDLTWVLVKSMKKISFTPGDIIYADNSVSDNMYFIHQGYVKLFAENQFPFAVFRNGKTFGEIELFCNVRRNGEARAMEYC